MHENYSDNTESDDVNYAKWSMLESSNDDPSSSEDFDHTMYQSREEYEQANHVGKEKEHFIMDAAGDIEGNSHIDSVFKSVYEKANEQSNDSLYDALSSEVYESGNAEDYQEALDAYQSASAINEMNKYDDENVRDVAGLNEMVSLMARHAENNPNGASEQQNKMIALLKNALYDYTEECDLADVEHRQPMSLEQYFNSKIRLGEINVRGGGDDLNLRTFQSAQAMLNGLHTKYAKSSHILKNKTRYTLLT